MNTNHESVAYRSFSPSKFEARGARKVTTGITGLWQPRYVDFDFFLSVYVHSFCCGSGVFCWGRRGPGPLPTNFLTMASSGPADETPAQPGPKRSMRFVGEAAVTRDYAVDLGQARATEIIQGILGDPTSHDIDRETGCWLWGRALNTTGRPSIKRYTSAQLALQGQTGVAPGRNTHVNFLVYRISFLAQYGRDITMGNVSSHLCDEQTCFNPLHISDEPQKTNVDRMGCRGVVWCPDHPGHLVVDFCPHEPKCIRRAGDAKVTCCLTEFQRDSQKSPSASLAGVAAASGMPHSEDERVGLPSSPPGVPKQGLSSAPVSSDPALGPGRKRKYSEIGAAGLVGSGEGGDSSSASPVERRLPRRSPEYLEASQLVLASVREVDPGSLSGVQFSSDLDYEVEVEESDHEGERSDPAPADRSPDLTSSLEGSSLGGFIARDSSPPV